jgi:hypothetical protein
VTTTWRRICTSLTSVACALVLGAGLGASPASAGTPAGGKADVVAAGWQSAGYYNNGMSCSIGGANGKAQGRWTDYACVPAGGGLYLLLVNIP